MNAFHHRVEREMLLPDFTTKFVVFLAFVTKVLLVHFEDFPGKVGI